MQYRKKESKVEVALYAVAICVFAVLMALVLLFGMMITKMKKNEELKE